MLLQQTLLLLPKPSSPLSSTISPNPNPNRKPSPLLSISSTTPRIRSKPSPPSALSPNPAGNNRRRRIPVDDPPEAAPRAPERGGGGGGLRTRPARADLRRHTGELRVLEGKEEEVLKSRDESIEEEEEENQVVVEEEDPDWPLDADIGWGIRSSEYFEKHPIRNVVVDGVEIDWEGEMEEGWVKEINCLEWESFAFHPSPLVALVFERYKRAADNWKLLKELEKAAKVYWSAKDRLPPRTVKIDINIETDLAYALKVKECPQLLFLKGNKILYREKEMRSAEELVQMIAHFYYNAKRPSWVDATAVAPPF
uniref:Thioredoxin-like fold domain-containing protein MRL7, chloroplastic n=1 Tax=Ananas comosus var. bracteatus TaxID=296719 RepID=A0A6V7Q7U7_ANACO|nr:unnamed protein product [Ananas comosus var. bracteatus]